jgi:ribosomal protein S18 acetylase RimI-like enzyme
MTQGAITIRLAEARDAQTIATMSRDLVEPGLGWRYDPAKILRKIKHRDTVTLVASDRGRTAGFAIMEFGEDRAHLVLLAVRPTHRRQGIGRKLVEWLLESARTAGIASIHLELRTSNEAARRFYMVMGFSETLVVPGYYSGPGGAKESALRMLLVLRTGDTANWTWQPPTFGKNH